MIVMNINDAANDIKADLIDAAHELSSMLAMCTDPKNSPDLDKRRICDISFSISRLTELSKYIREAEENE